MVSDLPRFDYERMFTARCLACGEDEYGPRASEIRRWMQEHKKQCEGHPPNTTPSGLHLGGSDDEVV